MTENLTSKPAGGRNYGVDLFRIVSMLMVVTLHVLNRGGALSASTAYDGEWQAAWIFEIVCYGAVDCYALISGYVCYGRRHKYSRAVYVWLEVLFYTVLSAAIFLGTGMWEITDEAVRYSLFPIVHGHYWYITAYIGMTFFIPLMNAAVEHVSGKDACIFTGAALILFMTVPRLADKSMFSLGGGYSMAWLMILYFAGAFIRRFEVCKNTPMWMLGLVYFACIAVTWVTRILGRVELVSYISPTIFISSAVLLIMFSRLNIKGRVSVWLIKNLSPATLGVYIIHVNYFVWRKYMDGFARGFAGGGVLRLLALSLAAALSIYFVCSVIDIVRIKLFELCRIRRALDALDHSIERAGNSRSVE